MLAAMMDFCARALDGLDKGMARGRVVLHRALDPHFADAESAALRIASLRSEATDHGARLAAVERERDVLAALLRETPLAEVTRWWGILEAAEREMVRGGLPPDTTRVLHDITTLGPRLVPRIQMLYRALDRDRTGLGQALSEVGAIASSWSWVAEGRAAGGYAWDEDGYQKETDRCLSSIAEIVGTALGHSGTVATRAIHGEPPPPDRLPVAEALGVLLVDEERLVALLSSRWSDIRQGSASGLPSNWRKMEKAEVEALLRLARVVLHALTTIPAAPAPVTPSTSATTSP